MARPYTRLSGDPAADDRAMAPEDFEAGGRFVIESGDPSIPLDRVPYFTKDLVRLAVVGVAMLVLLGVGSITMPLLIK